MRILILLIVFFSVFLIKEDKNLVSESFFHLNGKSSLTIIKNSTPDTIKLKGNYFSFFTYSETNFRLTIPPGEQDTIVVKLAYPDFIELGQFRVFNSPNKTVVANVLKLQSSKWRIAFEKDLSAENTYYTSYQDHTDGFQQESRPYYEVGSRIQDFNKFPLQADSIHTKNISFLERYDKPLPVWFKRYERWRLRYNNGFRKDHVLFDLEFKTGKKITVNSNYYDFDKQLPINNQEAIISNDFLWYTMFYLRRQSLVLDVSKIKQDPMLYVIDSLFRDEEIGDVLKVKRLLDMSRESKDSFGRAIEATTFKNASYQEALASLLYSKVGLPVVGKKSPTLILKDVNGKDVALSSLVDRVMIINFWASWCAPCIKEFPYENKLYNDYKDKGITIVNICVDTDKAKWKEVSVARDLQMVNLYVEREEYETIKSSFDLNVLPKSIVLDKNLVVRDNHFKRASQVTATDIKQLLNNY